ncbi:hypothetical protein TRFO_18498 [Tritrichomonas foetus]|uniref:Uncharacterized protein n=1 Tax=Tritrichomonas foetus TaxID=1144522 RepID=A0A1J4KLU8_9EUKA|nr:hypothetical protein TRFO_18498 [Tritrichomonas foetus]|eukprot:OHT11912.1 hypothetical protein TRFO_18498 [Tritrichomonas foetus]
MPQTLINNKNNDANVTKDNNELKENPENSTEIKEEELSNILNNEKMAENTKLEYENQTQENQIPQNKTENETQGNENENENESQENENENETKGNENENETQGNENENKSQENENENESQENENETKGNENENEEEKSPETDTGTSSSMILQFTPFYSEEEVDNAFKDLMKYKRVPDTNMFPQILQRIYREKTDAIDNQDYDRAKQLENAITLINKENDSMAYETLYDNQNRYIAERESRLHQKLHDTKIKYKVKMDRHLENCEFRLRQLKEKHQREVNELKVKYQDPNFLRQFNRPSQNLLNLRRNERKLALAKKYDEARRIKRMADSLQSKEELAMKEVTHQSMQNEYLKLVEKQQQEMEKMVAFDKKTEKEIEIAKIKELTPIETAIKQTAVRKAETESRQNSSVSKGYNPVYARDVVAKNQSVATPRTMQKLKKIRDNHAVELKVSPIKDSTFSRLENLNKKMMKSKLPKLIM